MKLVKHKTNISFQEGTTEQTREIVRILHSLQAASTSILITKAWHAAGIFKKPVEKYTFDKETLVQYHYVDVNKAQKIRVFNEEDKSRIKSVSENLCRSRQHDTERILPEPSRIRMPEKLTKGQIEWLRIHRDEYIDPGKFF